jgi:prepilin-type N-terminal cleavage/methylation domain-containing protein
MTRKIKGFTLIELMIVITIIAILAVIGVANMTQYLEKRKDLNQGRTTIEKVEPNQPSNGLQKLNIK